MDNNSEVSKLGKRRIFVQIIVDVIIWLTVSLVVLYLFLYGKPHKRGFFCDDISLSLPSIPETIPTHILVALGFIASILLVVFIEVCNCVDRKCRQSFYQADGILFCVRSYIVFLIGFLIQELFVDAMKNSLGVLRPNFFDVCNPQFNKTMCPGYISKYICTGGDEKELRSSRQSFPSGHSTFAMYIAIFYCLYTEYRLQVRFSCLLKVFLQTGLVLAAVVCGFGRIRDNKHHLSDVIAGFILGITAAVFVFFMIERKFVINQSVKRSIFVQGKSRDCRYEQPSSDLDPQAPSPLLENEYFQNIEQGRNPSSSKNKNNHQEQSLTSEIV